jgi:SAM-dependent methyltransferase
VQKEISQKINNVWSNRGNKEGLRLHWWYSKKIIQHVNKKVCGQPLESLSAGITQKAMKLANGKPFLKGISVGCGNGGKEMRLIQAGLVDQFDLYELSDRRIEQGKQLAQKLRLTDKVTFHKGDAFEMVTRRASFDIVHWNNSLHHMMNVDQAVQWSHNILRKGGLFYMDDFIGPSRFQWSDRMLEIATRVHTALPVKYLIQPPWSNKKTDLLKNTLKKIINKIFPSRYIVKPPARPTVQSMIDRDPSEAADSERILDSVKKYFPSAEIMVTGGAVYHLALNQILYNFDEDKDKTLLELLLIIDDLCSEQGENHYAVALAIKED